MKLLEYGCGGFQRTPLSQPAYLGDSTHNVKVVSLYKGALNLSLLRRIKIVHFGGLFYLTWMKLLRSDLG